LLHDCNVLETWLIKKSSIPEPNEPDEEHKTRNRLIVNAQKAQSGAIGINSLAFWRHPHYPPKLVSNAR
jgi:hypothetical protein